MPSENTSTDIHLFTGHELTGREFRTVQAILEHPEYLPTLPEIEWITDIDTKALNSAVESLKDRDIIEPHTTTPDLDGINKDEVTFYALTEKGLNIVSENNIFNDTGLMREMYEKVVENTDRPDRVNQLAAVNRPDKRSIEK